MRKLLLLATSLTGLLAQDFSPNQKAQGYLDFKNATVDYAMGLFRYPVLYRLRSGGFRIADHFNTM